MTAQVSPPLGNAPSLLDTQVTSQVRNHIGYLTLNRPQGLNTLTLAMVRSLQGILDAWALDNHIQAVVLRGAGDKAFCAGGDIRALYDSHVQGSTHHVSFFQEEYALDLTLHHYRKPVLCVMHGYTLGGGMGLAQATDLRIVTDSSRLGMPEVAIGYFPDVGASYFLPRISGELGIYLGVTGVQIEAADALYCGLADWYLAAPQLELLEERLDRISWSGTPLKDLQNVLSKLGVQTLPDAPLNRLRPAIDHFFSQPSVGSMIEQLHQVTVANSHKWADGIASLMETRSPLAMAVTLDMLRRGRGLSLEGCFDMEQHLGQQWFEQGDLVEGIRALLVDKDKLPKWRHRSTAQLKDEQVQRFFAGL
jgi:enoyl-CoA hydratase/carnithine racemase